MAATDTITHRRILTVLAGGAVLTDEDIVEAFINRYGDQAASPSGIRSRRKELADAGKVAQSVIRRTPGAGKRSSALWFIPTSES